MAQTPDTATAKDSGQTFPPHPEGQFAMVCADVINMGWKVEQYEGKPPKEVEKVALVFASGERHEGELLLVTVEYTLSMYETANLRKLLQAWRGKEYTSDEAEAGVPLHKLHGRYALVSVAHAKSKKGRKFAKIGAIFPLPTAVPAPSKDVMQDYTRPKFFEDRKKEYALGVARLRSDAGVTDDPGPEAPNDDPDSDLPF